MSTVRELYKSYTQQSFYIRKPFFDAVINEDFNHSTNRFLKGKLARGIQPRGKVWKKMLNDYVNSRRRARWGKSPLRDWAHSVKQWPTPQ